MARSAYYFGSDGTSFEERLQAVEEILEQDDQNSRILPRSIHFGGGTNYVTSPFFPRWFRSTDAAPYATTLLSYNQFPINAEAAAIQPAGFDRLVYITGDKAANQLDIPSYAWNRDRESGELHVNPYRAYIDNVDVELSFSVDWAPDCVEKKRPWHCRVLLIADNEPFVQSVTNQAGVTNEIISPQYTPRDLIAAQPGVDHRYINAIPGIQTALAVKTPDVLRMFPHWQYSMCDLATRSPLRKPLIPGEEMVISNVPHARQYGKQIQLSQVADGGVDYAATQTVSNIYVEPADPLTSVGITDTVSTWPQVYANEPDWPENSPKEFIFTPSARNFTVYKDMTITLSPPDFIRSQGPPSRPATSFLASNTAAAGANAAIAMGGTSAMAGGLPSYTLAAGDTTAIPEIIDRYGDNRLLRQNYVFNIKIPIRALQQWTVNKSEEEELRVLNRRFKLVFIHSPTRFWGGSTPEVAGGSYSIYDTWSTQLNALGAGVVATTPGWQMAIAERQCVQCPDVNMNVGLVIHFNQKTSHFTKDYPLGLAIQDSMFKNDPVPGSSAAAEAAWRQGDSQGSSTVRFANTPKRQRAG